MRKLRDYQLAAEQALYKCWQHCDSALIALPTGTGKTVLFSQVTNARLNEGPILVLAHQRQLLQQASQKMRPVLGWTPPIEDGITKITGDISEVPVIIGSVHTMRNDKTLAKFMDWKPATIIIDEAHRTPAQSYRRVINHFREKCPALKILGVTATPTRSDGLALGTIFDQVAYEMDLKTAIEKRWLVPLRQTVIECDELDLTKVKTVVDKTGDKDLDPKQLEAALMEEKAAHEMAAPIVDRTGVARRTVVFAATKRHAELLVTILNRHLGQGVCQLIISDVPPEQREVIYDAYEHGAPYEGTVPRCLVTVDVLTEGWDSPPVNTVVIASPTKSIGRYMQRIGRGTRPLDGVIDGLETVDERKTAIAASLKPFVEIVDFNGGRDDVCSCFDALEGNFDLPEIKLAKEITKARATDGVDEDDESTDVEEALAKARALAALRAEDEKLGWFKPRVEYSEKDVDPFSGDGATNGTATQGVGTATEKQIAKLVDMGVSRETAARYKSGQAWKVLTELRAKRCSDKQARVLKRCGLNPEEFNFASASAMIDDLAKNNWKVPA